MVRVPSWNDLPGALRPMLAVPGELPSDDAGWAYEMKWDGLRALVRVSGDAVSLWSRTGREITAGYPELRGLAAAAGQGRYVLDGEIVAFGGQEWPDFEALQQRMNIAEPSAIARLAAEIPATFLAFDVLYADGGPVVAEPYLRRRQRLEQLDLNGAAWQTPPSFTGVSGAQVRAVSREHALEGIVAKRAESRYEAGRRADSWRKIKNLRGQEMVVGGWKPGQGNREGVFGSLLIGVHEPGLTGLSYSGHVGTGFDQRTLRMLSDLLEPLRRETSPFGTPVPPEHARSVVWVEPVVVIEVAFTGWTAAGRLRAPVYRGLRADKPAGAVFREPD